MGVEITETVMSVTSYAVKGFVPCCKEWAAEIGDHIQAVSDGSGFVPADLFFSKRLINKMAYSQLRRAWNYCPYCGHEFVVKTAAAEPLIVLEK